VDSSSRRGGSSSSRGGSAPVIASPGDGLPVCAVCELARITYGCESYVKHERGRSMQKAMPATGAASLL
jgi:hypothetical protein